MAAKKKQKEVLFVPVEGAPELRTIPADSLEAMQKMVGGYVEPVRLTGRMVIYVNEEGIRLGLAYNERLSLVAHRPLVGDGFVENPDEGMKWALLGTTPASAT